jgi:predicted DNA-binding transcriptional regulator YafY
MTWATDRRLDYIDLLLLTRGQVQRSDIATAFGVSVQQATADIRDFLAAHPTAARYDGTAKRYVPAFALYRAHRTTDETRRALLLLTCPPSAG